jgi:hypothetical protein
MTDYQNDILGVVDESTQRQYAYYLTDLRDNEVIAELPLVGVSYATVLSNVGDFNGKITINPETNVYDVRRSTIPGQTGLYVLRDGRPVWGGIIWKRRYDETTRTVDIVASTFESYLGVRLQPLTQFFEDTDQLDIARWLLTNSTVTSRILANVSNATSPRLRERQFNSWERKTVLDEMTRLGNLIDGFDWNVVVGRDSQTREISRTFEFFYPKRGVSADSSELLFEFPGSIRTFNVDEDAQAGANIVHAVGIGEGIDQLIATATAEDQIAAGYPEIEVVQDYNSVSEQETLQAHADEDLVRLTTPVTIFEVTVDARTDPALGSYEVGDWARFRIQDDFITPAIDQYARITAIEVTIDDGSGLEQVTITLGGEEVENEEEEND